VVGALSDGGNPTASRINDLNPSDIETIEILHGPSAATEYGTDAANGVIVVTTKRGHTGPTHWDLYADQGISRMPAHFPDNYTSWGHTTDGTSKPEFCPWVGPQFAVGLGSQAGGTCVVDSVTRFEPLDHAATSIFGTGYRSRYGAQISGGVPSVRYFVSGDYTGELGAIQMPPAEATVVERERGVSSVPGDQLHPNTLVQNRLRATLDATAGRTADVSVATAYMNTGQRTPTIGQTLMGAYTGLGIRDSVNGYFAATPGSTVDGAPRYVFAHTSGETVGRLTGTLTGHWQPLVWLTSHGTLGLDDENRSTTDQVLPGEVPAALAFTVPNGYRSRGMSTNNVYSADFGATATATPSRHLALRSSIGVQYAITNQSGTGVGVTNLPLGVPSLNGTVVVTTSFGTSGLNEQFGREGTLGTYLEETVGLDDRLFATGAVRIDDATGFGSAYTSATYPKASLSWVAVQQPATRLRLRAAYGASGVQPNPGASLQLYAPTQTLVNGSLVPGQVLSSFGNPGLRPERSAELEGGTDIGLFSDRLTLELTAYSKTTHDALIDVPLAGSLGGGPNTGTGSEQNIGSVRNSGFEGTLSARPIDTRLVAWDLTIGGSTNRNRLLRLAPSVPLVEFAGILISQYPYRQRPGYPLYGIWGQALGYHDANHDGRIEPDEVTLSDTAVYLGAAQPTRQVTVSSGVTVLKGALRLATQFDYAGGYKIPNIIENVRQFFSFNSSALNNPSAPLADQARSVAAGLSTLGEINSGFVEDGTYVRWRELSLTWSVPVQTAAVLHARSASITLACRNLRLWTKYSGPDPEANNNGSVFGFHEFTGDNAGVPLMRQLMLRLNLGL
jgi:TonB-dependent SusC/RagA subfamily outer membrane receptor